MRSMAVCNCGAEAEPSKRLGQVGGGLLEQRG